MTSGKKERVVVRVWSRGRRRRLIYEHHAQSIDDATRELLRWVLRKGNSYLNVLICHRKI